MNSCDVRFMPREQEVLNLISQHYTYEKIASDMNISIKTLYKYVENISKKIGLQSTVGRRARHGITQYAIANGYGKSEVAS